MLEGVLARGDRRLSEALLKVYKKGAIFDAWTEHFDYDKWEETFKECGIDMDFYTTRERSIDEVLPWDILDVGVTKQFLIKEWERAKEATVTPNCRAKCAGCGAMMYKGGVCYEAKN